MSQENPPRSISKNRSWMWAALFVWSLTGVVALAAFGGKDKTPPPLALQLKPPPGAAVPTTVPAQIAWESDFESAMARAKRENKPIMVDFYTEWCSACKFLDANIYTAEPVRAASNDWISVKVDAEKRADLAQAYGVTGYPTVVFARPDGSPLDVQSGAPQQSPLFVEWMQSARAKF